MVNVLRFRYIVFGISVSRIGDLVKRFLSNDMRIQACTHDKHLLQIWFT